MNAFSHTIKIFAVLGTLTRGPAKLDPAIPTALSTPPWEWPRPVDRAARPEAEVVVETEHVADSVDLPDSFEDEVENHVIIDRVRVRADLDPANTEFAEAEKYIYPAIRHSTDELIISDYNNPAEANAVERFAKKLRGEEGQFFLISQLNGQPVPAFNARLLREGVGVTHNLKVFKFPDDAESLTEFIRYYVAKIDRYASREAWVEYVLKQMRESRGLDRHDPLDRFELESADDRAYVEAVATTRRMMYIFGVDRRRPVKIMIWSPSWIGTPNEVREFANLIPPGSLIDEILVLDQRKKLLRIKIALDGCTRYFAR